MSTEWLDASFRGVPFECQDTSDPVKRAIALYEYPYRDGGEADDMGRRARVFSFTVLFWGDTYKAEHEAFCAALDATGPGELIHPMYGSHTVLVQEYTPKNSAEGPDSCTMTVSFVEHGLHTPFFGDQGTAKGAAESAADGAIDALDTAVDLYSAGFEAWVNDLIKAAPSTNILHAVEDILHAGSRMLDDITGGADALIAFLDFPRSFVGALESAYAKVRIVAGYGDDAAGRFSGWQRLSTLCKAVSAGGKTNAKTYGTSPAPASVTPPTLAALAEDAAASTGVTPSGAPSASPAQANPLVIDRLDTGYEGDATALVGVGHAVVSARTVADAVCEILRADADAPALNPAEVEIMVGNTRERLQDAMAMVRAILPPHRIRPVTEALRDAAAQVQALGEAVIDARPPLITHTLTLDGNAHLIAHHLYGDYSRAGEIMRLNPGIRRPNAMQRGQRIRIYAE